MNFEGLCSDLSTPRLLSSLCQHARMRPLSYSFRYKSISAFESSYD